MDIAFPLSIDKRGQLAEVDYTEHIRQLIEQILFTLPGERVNRPDFGTDLRRLLFTDRRDAMLTAVEATVQAALSQYSNHVIQVEAVEIVVEETTVKVEVRYVELTTRRRALARFEG